MADAVPSRRLTYTRYLVPGVYGLLAGFLTLAVACRFYASLRLQTLHALHWASPTHFSEIVERTLGPWSAPLDDVFIHFDFARSTARGLPFQWSPGNGYSSGGTSLLYPFVLALGYLLGFRELRLMEWAGIVACVCTFGTLLAARRLAADLPGPASLLLPFAPLSVGALAWSLFSGMEVALFLALWGAAYLAYEDLRDHFRKHSVGRPVLRALALGIWCGLLTATRPEGITAIAVLVAAALYEVFDSVRRDSPTRARFDKQTLLRTARVAAPLVALAVLPSIAVLVAHAVANQIFTGERTAAGALVKLEAHHPHLSAAAVREAWWFHVKYQVLRVTHYHFADQAVYGWIVWVLAAAAFAFRATRRPALILWGSAIFWILLVATNGQVRWQNERYTMPAVAWLLFAAALGTGALLTAAATHRHKLRGPLFAGGTALLVALFVTHQAPRYREQIWFFGRAARNILDQHIMVGTRLRYEMNPPPRRVLVGDAGAIPYVSDLPALDIIGLGGFGDLPFARATREHVGAAVELIEHIAPSQRPDVLAIYPGWWGDFPLWFGTKIGEVPVRGNVICGGASKVVYKANWEPLRDSGSPFEARPREQVVDALDLADVLSERAHEYRISGVTGYVGMKLLDKPGTRAPLFDAGRIIAPGGTERFQLRGLDPSRPARLIFRAAPSELVEFPVTVDGASAGIVRLTPKGGWVEVALENIRPAGSTIDVQVGPSRTERILHHVFVVQDR